MAKDARRRLPQVCRQVQLVYLSPGSHGDVDGRISE